MQAKPLVAVAAAAVSLLLGWWWFAHEGVPQVPAPPSTTPVAETAVPAAGAAPAAAADRPAEAAAGGVERTEVVGAVADPRGSATYEVRGRLVDVHGAPRVGVELGVSTWPADGATDGGPELGPDQRPKSDREGRFRLSIPVGSDGQLHVQGGELEFAAESPRFRSAAGDQDLGDLVVLRASSLAGVVQDELGRPVADVKVEATLGAFLFDTRSGTKTGADGRFTIGKLRPGKWVLRTASSRFLPTALDVEVASEQQQTDLVVTVRTGDAIAGRVVDDRGVGVAGFRVACKRREMQGAMDVERFSSDEAATTDAAGFFTLAGLPKGTTTVRAFGAGHTAATAADVAVGTGDLVLRVQRTAAIEGVLSTADGTPIADSEVGVLATRTNDDLVGNLAAPTRPVTTAADGTFRLVDVAPGPTVLRATGAGHLPTQLAGVQVAPAQTVRGVRIVADAGVSARVRVVDPAGAPVAGAKVRAALPGQDQFGGIRVTRHADAAADGEPTEVTFDDPSRVGEATTGDDGTATIPGLPARDVQFVASHADFASTAPVVASLAARGTVEVRLVLQQPGFAAVQVLDGDGAPMPGAEVHFAPADAQLDQLWMLQGNDNYRTATTDPSGKARLGPFAPGDYRAVLGRPPRDESSGGMRMVFAGNETLAASAQAVRIEAGRTVDVVLRRPILARVHGRLLGADGPLAGGTVCLEQRDNGLGALGAPTVTVAGDGSFAFADVEPGSYTLSFGREHQVVRGRHDLEVPPNTAEVRQDLSLRVGRLTVRVHRAGTGEPVDGATVEIEPEVGEGGATARQMVRFATITTADGGGGEAMTMTVGAQRVRTDATGLATVDDVPVGSWRVRVSDRGCVPVERAAQLVVERQTTDVGRVDLVGAGRVRCSVRGGNGEALDLVMVQHRAADATQWSQPAIGTGGSVQVDDLAAGRYALRAKNARGGDWCPEVEVEVVAGATADAELRVR
ncbi:MAG: carboxypeptidase regulatory-like domain-containing protein [Planctomycetes bacterium]|nr:carboxypeptidase regulatory-like domain-containing protein [Planctomycetota bacterium]